MNIFDFEQNLKKTYSNKLNVIYTDDMNNFICTNVNGSTQKMDVVNDEYVYFNTVKELKKKSKVFVNSYKTLLVLRKGTNAKDWDVTEI